MAAIGVCVDPQHVKQVWYRVEHFIREAIERVGLCNFDDVADDVLCGSALLWLVWDGKDIQGAVVTELTTDRVCTIVAYGGRMADLHLLRELESYARAEGCNRIRIMGRKGWVRVLNKYRQPYVILEKELI
jgi:hypothetical protein